MHSVADVYSNNIIYKRSRTTSDIIAVLSKLLVLLNSVSFYLGRNLRQHERSHLLEIVTKIVARPANGTKVLF